MEINALFGGGLGYYHLDPIGIPQLAQESSEIKLYLKNIILFLEIRLVPLMSVQQHAHLSIIFMLVSVKISPLNSDTTDIYSDKHYEDFSRFLRGLI